MCMHTHTVKDWGEVGGDWLGPSHIISMGSSHSSAQEKEEAIPNAGARFHWADGYLHIGTRVKGQS